MICPGCQKDTIRVRCSQEWQGDPPHIGLVEFVDWIERECDCQLTDQQERDIDDHAVCDEPDDDDRGRGDYE